MQPITHFLASHFAGRRLFGYPHVARLSTGVHDRLGAAALYLRQDRQGVLFIANELNFVGKLLRGKARRRISIITAIPMDVIANTTTYIFSGPVTFETVFSRSVCRL